MLPEPSHNPVLKIGTREIVKYLQFKASKQIEKQKTRFKSVRQRIENSKVLASKLLEIQQQKKVFPASLEEIESLPKDYAQRYLYRGGPIKRIDVPIAMESIEKPTDGIVVIFADGHYELVRNPNRIKGIKERFLVHPATYHK